MGMIDKFTNKDGFSTKKHRRNQDQQFNSVEKVHSINPNTPQPSQTIKDQAKEKLTTSKYFKAIFKKPSMFDNNKINTLSIDNLKFIFDDNAVSYYNDYFGINNVKDTSDYQAYKTVKHDLPEKLIGGGEGDLLPSEGIDLKKTYNSEAKALAIAYYSNTNNLKDLKRLLYSITGVYANLGMADLDEVKKELEKTDFNKLTDEEIKLEFKEAFAKTMKRDSGKMTFIQTMLNEIDNLHKLAKDYQEEKLSVLNEKYASMYEREFKEIFKLDKEVIVDEFIEALRTLKSALGDKQTINDLKDDELGEEIKDALKVVSGSGADILNNTKEELEEKLEKFDRLERVANVA